MASVNNTNSHSSPALITDQSVLSTWRPLTNDGTQIVLHL